MQDRVRVWQRAAAVSLLLLGTAAPVLAAGTLGGWLPGQIAQQLRPEAAWQAVIRGQIDAFRSGDGSTALSFAGASFQQTFHDPNAFYAAIESGGYAPIVHSRSMAFGDFVQVDPRHVLQVVRLIGSDQLLYRAVYQLGQEQGGWRIEGVMLAQDRGVAA